MSSTISGPVFRMGASVTLLKSLTLNQGAGGAEPPKSRKVPLFALSPDELDWAAVAERLVWRLGVVEADIDVCDV